MSIWWAERGQLDKFQIELIEDLDLAENYLVLGPPGSGKTNILLRRAQFTRAQGFPNVLVLTFTRSLTEFLKTGCITSRGAEIFPISCISTIEGWVRELHKTHGEALPSSKNYVEDKKEMALHAAEFVSQGKQPKYDVLFVDETQDLTAEEVHLIKSWGSQVFFVGDDNQKIYDHGAGLSAIRQTVPKPIEKELEFHYRLCTEVCEMAGRIRGAGGENSLKTTSLYDGPKPGKITVHKCNDRTGELAILAANLRTQLRAYGDLIARGDKLGIVVRKRDERDLILQSLENEDDLQGLAQVVRARSGEEDDRGYDPTLDPSKPILILTEHGCKGLEFRALHWLFVDDNSYYRTDEQAYTVVTRAKTSLDIYHQSSLPQSLARAHAEKNANLWDA